MYSTQPEVDDPHYFTVDNKAYWQLGHIIKQSNMTEMSVLSFPSFISRPSLHTYIIVQR